MMRRFALVLLALASIVALDWAPGIPPFPVPVASAQPPFSFGLYSQGVVQYNTASISATNTTNEVLLWQSLIPGALMATSANSNWSPSSVATPPPLHLHLEGTVNTNAPSGAVGNVNVGVNYGGGVTGVATMALLNAVALTNALSNAQVHIDICLAPIATASQSAGVQGSVAAMFMTGRMAVQTSSTAETIYAASVIGTTGGGFLASTEQLNVLWKWASATNTNALNIYQGVLSYGCKL